MVALAISFLGRTELAVRLPTALASAGTVFAVFGWGRSSLGGTAGGPPRGAVCWLAELGPVCWRFPSAKRSWGALRSSQLPAIASFPVSGPALAGVVRRSLWRIALAGVCAGYTYIPCAIHAFSVSLLWFELLHPWVGISRSGGGPIRTAQQSRMRVDYTFLVNVWAHLLAFGFRGDPNWRHNFSGQWQAFFF